MGFLFPLTLFLSAALLFSIQPMVAKALLPVYGGTPGVWTVCMLFFQLILLGAYGYAWLLSLLKTPRIWRVLHTLLMLASVMAMPLLFHPVSMDVFPEWAIGYNLLTQVGLPLFLIASSAPLLQFAYSQSQAKNASDPYFLYVASNCGSLLTLLAYPWLIERFIGLNVQFNVWNIGFVLYLILLFLVLYTTKYQALNPTAAQQSTWTWKQITYWIFLSFLPCSLMLGVTLYITTDVAATPLFWVVPLALYLLSFVVSFSAKSWISHEWIKKYAVYFLLATVVLFLFGPNQIHVWQIIIINLANFFILALLSHRELYLRRPKSEHLTLFYFCISIGGVLAGLFNGLVAPHVFNQVLEYPIALGLSLLLLPKSKSVVRWGVSALVLVLLVLPLHTQNVLVQNRSFYAVNRVEDKQGVHVFFSQSTVHGLQAMNEDKPPNGFRSYYGAVQPVVEAMQQQNPFMAVTIMGLGTGNMLCQFRAADTVNAIEIDQQVINIAQDTKLFTYLRDCLPKKQVIKNDGRLALGNLEDASQNLLVLDAFNSDAIPVHLMTLEAFNLYKQKITKDGLILINLSNRHVQLLPIINAVARSLDLIPLHLLHKGDRKLGQFDSEWALLTSNQDLAFTIMQHSNWQFVAEEKQFLWTDDYSNIVPLLKII